MRKHCAILRATTGPAAGLEIDVRLSSGRVVISMCTQAGPTGARYLHRDHPAPQITCDPKRNARQIAAHIARRLLPPARRLFALETEAIQQMWRDAARKEETIRLLEQITGRKRSPNFSDTIYLPHGEARVSGADSVNIELRYLDLETAADILNAVYGC